MGLVMLYVILLGSCYGCVFVHYRRDSVRRMGESERAAYEKYWKFCN